VQRIVVPVRPSNSCYWKAVVPRHSIERATGRKVRSPTATTGAASIAHLSHLATALPDFGAVAAEVAPRGELNIRRDILIFGLKSEYIAHRDGLARPNATKQLRAVCKV
jgi:hypothetical protein